MSNDKLENVETTEDDDSYNTTPNESLLRNQTKSSIESYIEEPQHDFDYNNGTEGVCRSRSRWQRFVDVLMGRDGDGDLEAVSFLALFRFASPFHKTLLGISTLCSILIGMTEPFFVISFGRLMDILMGYAQHHDSVELWEKATPLIFINFIIALILVFAGFFALVSRTEKRQQKSAHSAGAVLQESIMHVKTVQSCNGQQTMVGKYNSFLELTCKDRLPQHFWSGFLDGIFILALYLFNIISSSYGIDQVIAGEMTIGEMQTVMRCCNWSSYMVGILMPDFICIFKARVAAAMVYKLIDQVPETIDCYSNSGETLSTKINGRITFNNVRFAYPNRKAKTVLNDISWVAEPGKHVALVGHSGSGKSTCLSLLTRLYECSAGCVEIDNIDVKCLRISDLRKSIGIVQQEPTLFNCSIMDNITLGDDNIDMKSVKRACRAANAHDFIRKLKHGYSTVLGNDGMQLSGGQKQRIAIARAIVRDPAILLLDEATSALDAESEIMVQNALKVASKGRTTITIAHRLSTLRNADKIIVLDQGRVMEVGTHAELMITSNSIYAQLVKSQQLETKKMSSSSRPRWDSVSSTTSDQPLEQYRYRSRTITSAVSHTSLFSAPSLVDIGVADTKTIKSTRFGPGIYQLYRKYWNSQFIWACISSIGHGSEYCAYNALFFVLFVIIERYSTGIIEKNDLSYYVWLYHVASLSTGIFKLGVSTLSMTLYGRFCDRVVKQCKVNALKNILDQAASYFDNPSTNNEKVIQRISNDALAMNAALDRRLNVIVSHAYFIVLMSFLGFLTSWEIALVVVTLITLELLLLVWLGGKMVKNYQNIRLTDQSSKTAVEIIENVKTIQLLTKQKYFVERYHKALHENHPHHVTAALLEAFLFASTRATVFAVQTICILFGTYLLEKGYLQTVNVFGAVICMSLASDGVIGLVIFLNDFIKADSASSSIFELINATSTISNGHGKEEVRGDVAFQKVNFAYPNRQDFGVAVDLSLMANRGETIALVGASGAGKSTVVALLERYYEATGGKVTIDEKQINEFDLKHLRNQIALVGQEPVLFGGTIFDNVRLGVENLGMNEVIEACEIASAAKFIESLPMGYDTEVGEKGAQLSGGQKQRIAIARAVIRQPKILLLDEATSALDGHAEQAVQKALDSARSGRTCIIIAHRLSSITNADRICFMRNGKVVESGTHAELISNSKSAYAQMFRKQQIPT
ncbi:ABC transporter domain-containing protein [Ditylenchus destructor]|nr:ABC transporter domain-containing protein [Ditylenchus destructor]